MAAKAKTYLKDGKTQYTCKEKIAYHKKMANQEMKAGNTAKAIRHGVLAKKNTDKLQKFMSYSAADRDLIVKGQRPQGRPTFN